MLITESFINTCFSLIFCKTNVRKNRNLYSDIIEILNINDKNSIDLPILLKNKIECLNKICNLKLENKTDDNIIDSLSLSDKYKNIIPTLELKRNDELNENIILDLVKQVRLRKKLNFLLSNYNNLYNVLNTIRDNNFDSIDDIINDYENIIKKSYSNIIEQNRDVNIEAISSIDLTKDDFNPLLNKIVEKYDRKNTIPSGYDLLDNYILNSGFEKGRIYITCGTAGSGKSTLLINLMINAARNQFLINNSNNKKIFLYVTLENTVEESFMRLYQCLFNKTTQEILQDIQNKVDIQKMICDEFNKNNSTIILKYFKPEITTVSDIRVVIDEIINEYGKENIQSLYLDYLDMLAADNKTDNRWQDIGSVCLSLKLLSSEYNISIISPSHLERSSYSVDNIDKLSLANVGKSLLKVENSDSIIFMIPDKLDDSLIHAKMLKNRSGKNNISFDFKVNFENFKFINCFKVGSGQLENYNSVVYNMMNEDEMNGF